MQGWKSQWQGPSISGFASESVWRNWATSFAGHLFSTLVATFGFQPLLHPSHNVSIYPALRAEKVMGCEGTEQVCPPRLPAVLCPSLQLIAANTVPWWGRRETLNSACKWFTCFRAVKPGIFSNAGHACTQGRDFSGFLQDFLLVGFYYYNFGNHCSTSYFIFLYSMSEGYITRSQNTMNCRCPEKVYSIQYQTVQYKIME